MSSRRRPRNRRIHSEEDNQDRWLISYADFITLLFAFFVVMYAVSSSHEGSFQTLSDSIINAFRAQPSSIEPISLERPPTSSMVVEDMSIVPKITEIGPGLTYSVQDVKEPPTALDKLQDLANKNVMAQVVTEVNDSLKALIEQGDVTVNSDELWVEIDIKSEVLYQSGRAVIQPRAVKLLQDLAVVLNKLPNDIQVEGYTDNIPISNDIYPSNWELSAARAASVVHLFTQNGVDPQRLAAIGFGEYRPIADNATIEGRAKNRRIAIVVLADSEARRVLEVEKALPDQTTSQE